jgi:hypothetical protein
MLACSRSDQKALTHVWRQTPQIRAAIGPFGANRAESARYSHSMVPGGLLVMSNTTRFTPLTSLTMRLLIRASTS